MGLSCWRPLHCVLGHAMGSVVFAAMLGLAGHAPAQTTGTWVTAASGGLWSDSNNWSGGAIADGANALANFNTLNITANNTLHLDGARTIGSLTFGDTDTNSPAGWILDNNGNTANILTLSGTAPTITVNPLGTNRIDRSVTISAEIAGGSLTKAGAGLLLLTASNSYTGATTVSGGNGILAVSHGSALGATNAGTTVANGNQLRLVGGITVDGEALTITGTGASPGDTERRGALRSHSGSNVWTGPITIVGGVETWISGGALTISGGITGNNQILRLDQGTPIITGNPINLGTSGSLLVNSTARLAVGGNTFGNLRVDWGGNLILAAANAIPTNAILTMGVGGPSGAGVGALNLSGFDTTVARLQDGGTNHFNEVINNTSATAATFTINQAVNSTYLGRIIGNLGLTKAGVGILTLGGSNAYSGATLVSNGTLFVNGRHTGGGQYLVGSGATLGGTGVISAALASAAGGIVAPGNSIGTLTFNGNADLDGVLKIELNASGLGSSDLLSVTGSLDIAAATVDFDLLGGALDDAAYVFAQYGTLSGTFANILDAPDGYWINYSYNGNQIALVIPEPSTLSLLLFAAGACALVRRRRA